VLWTFYIFPGSVCLFGCNTIERPILGIYKSFTENECGNWETKHYNSVLGIHKSEPDICIGFSWALHMQCRFMLKYHNNKSINFLKTFDVNRDRTGLILRDLQKIFILRKYPFKSSPMHKFAYFFLKRPCRKLFLSASHRFAEFNLVFTL